MDTREARQFATEYLQNASTVSEYRDGELGSDWVYIQSWSDQPTASWFAADHLARTFDTEWKRTASGAAVKLPANRVPAVQVTVVDDRTCDPVNADPERVRPILERAFNPSQIGKIERGGFDGDYLVELAPELLGDVSVSAYYQGRKFGIEIVWS